ncbi:hypothetical protein TVAG_122050 [Trichomonas vaginalis G3]|uniref:Uncharacterized protein n=1 Tax=Trichomonas vaginalis (strain ATCC PRA-98 / G3) TaxID=412133 RepID=A2E9B6_TRIV3|nr:ankyrin repeat protein family [Trichomonas vaginalis G3]EAY10801.1 hypothetical protein TVAG_122050 [Trichomonas vaginalis G3]KAI5536059.1 ankyrin repeat protein family [Trichomonas vaginalis G3]|eukprot:XP_001323024.1 hypothetical protein [Trichomonas vaginalis G3]
MTPLMFASDHLDVVKYLISFGANKEAKDHQNWTPLMCASQEVILTLLNISYPLELV